MTKALEREGVLACKRDAAVRTCVNELRLTVAAFVSPSYLALRLRLPSMHEPPFVRISIVMCAVSKRRMGCWCSSESVSEGGDGTTVRLREGAAASGGSEGARGAWFSGMERRRAHGSSPSWRSSWPKASVPPAGRVRFWGESVCSVGETVVAVAGVVLVVCGLDVGGMERKVRESSGSDATS
eukprot:5904040-Pleurochrysis_carterae.AAC.1